MLIGETNKNSIWLRHLFNHYSRGLLGVNRGVCRQKQEDGDNIYCILFLSVTCIIEDTSCRPVIHNWNISRKDQAWDLVLSWLTLRCHSLEKMHVVSSVKTPCSQDIFQKKKKITQRQTMREACFTITLTVSGRSIPFPLVTLCLCRLFIWNNTGMHAPKHTLLYIPTLLSCLYSHHPTTGQEDRQATGCQAWWKNCRPLRPSLSQCQFPDDHGIPHRKWFHITGQQNNTK